MAQYKTEGILLAVRDWDDADRMVTLFSREYGKISAIAYGARRPRSQLAGAVQPFVHADLALTPGKGFESIKQCEIRQSFRGLRDNLINMAYAAFIAELVTELWPNREKEPAVFDLLLAVFPLLATRNPRITSLACAFQLLSLAGFRPECQVCVSCGSPLDNSARFDVAAGGGVCGQCAKPYFLEFADDVRNFINRLLALDFQDPGHFSITGAVLLQTERLMAEFIGYRLDRPLKSLAFIAAVI